MGKPGNKKINVKKDKTKKMKQMKTAAKMLAGTKFTIKGGPKGTKSKYGLLASELTKELKEGAVKTKTQEGSIHYIPNMDIAVYSMRENKIKAGDIVIIEKTKKKYLVNVNGKMVPLPWKKEAKK